MLLLLSPWQFAFTMAFHMLFPAITVGLAVLLAFVYGPTLINVQTVNATDWQ